MREFLLIIHGFSLNCYFWSLYTTSSQKENLYLRLRSELDSLTHEMIKANQGKIDSPVSFLGDTFQVVKFNKAYFKQVISSCEDAKLDDPFDLFRQRILVALYKFYEDLSRNG